MTSKFDFQPVLKGARVTVRPISSTDWDGMFAAAADPEIWEQHPASDRYTETAFRQYFNDAVDSGSAFAFVDQASDRIIGSSRYHGHDPVKSEVEIGWTFLARDYWGGSHNAEIKQLMLEHAFQYVDTVVFWVGEENLRSRKAMEKIGGELRDGIHFKDMSGDSPYVVYEIHNGRTADGRQKLRAGS
jgi:RimJ/RimL family protein N-acetyltransferase